MAGLIRAAALIVVAALLWGGGAVAQEVARGAALEAAYEEAFQEVLKDPANLDKTFRFAELAVRVGDLEGAIGALERMLLYNPDLPRVRLELGVLYFRLQSYAIARAYLLRALEGADVPETVRERVAVYLAEIEKRLSRHAFSGSIYGGLRWQSNANAGPSSTTVRVGGVPATLADEFTDQSDSNLFLSFTLRHVYDFQTQGGETWESNVLGYGSRQREQRQLNLGLLEVKSGPRGEIGLGTLGPIGYRPYVVASVITLGDEPASKRSLLSTRFEDERYLATLGGGLTLERSFGKRLPVQINYEGRRRVFRNSDRRPTANLQTGYEHRLRLGGRYLFTPETNVGLTGWLKRETAGKGFFANREAAIGPSLTVGYPAPWPFKRRWSSSLSAVWIWRRYDVPDPTIDPIKRRVDRERRIQFLTAIPLWKTLSLIATAQRVVVDSSLPNFKYNNTSVSVGLSYRF